MPSKLDSLESIKTCLCPNSCSLTTLNLLNDYLFPVTAAAPTTKSRTSRTGATKRQHTTDHAATSQITTIAERHKLAIEVINGCIRGLTNVASTPPTPCRVLPVENDTLTSRKLSKNASTESKALQVRSRNRSDRPTLLDSVDYLATCCSVSISYLQSIQSLDSAPPSIPLQTESARLNLAGKLLQTGKFKFALKEYKALKRRLEGIMQNVPTMDSRFVEEDVNTASIKHSKNTLTKNLFSGKENTPQGYDIIESETPENLSRILEFSNVIPSNSAFPFVIACQLGILRCVVGLKRYDVIEAILPSFSSPSSPLVLLKTFSRRASPKALTYTNSLLQTLSTLSPTLTPDTDLIAMNPNKSCSPKTSIVLQSLLLETMIFQRTLRPNEESKPWNPLEHFGIYLAAFNRRIKNSDPESKQESYILARDLVKRLRSMSDSPENMAINVLKQLSAASSEAEFSKECMVWTEKWLQCLTTLEDTTNEALIVLCNVRMAVLEIRLTKADKLGNIAPDSVHLSQLEGRVKSAVEGLTNVARGRKQDLELLLQEAGHLRRSSLGLLVALLEAGETGEGVIQPGTKNLIREMCDEALKAVILFCRRYRGMGISAEQKLLLIPIVIPAVEAVLCTCWRDFRIDNTDSWESCESVLKLSWAVVKMLEEDKAKGYDILYVKFSTAYWQIFLLYRNNAGSEPEAARALRKSILALDGRPTDELVKASIVLKWERLGSIFILARDFNKAEEPLFNAIKYAEATGLLQKLENRSKNGESIHQIMTTPSTDSATIGRSLTGLVKIAMKRKDGGVAQLRFHDSLSIATEGVILEWSLRLAMDNMVDDGEVARNVAERLLDLYSFEEKPLRRSRVIASLLSLEVDHPGLLNTDEVINLGEDVVDWFSGSSLQLEEDLQLECYKNDIIARNYVGLAYCYWQSSEIRRDLVVKALELWTQVMTEDSWEDVRKNLDDVETLIRRLEMMVQFFDMKLEVELKVKTLKVLLKLRDLEKPRNYNALINIYSSLGLEYHRLGYSGKASVALGKAQTYLKLPDCNVVASTKLQWHLAYTEYLVGINHIDKSLEYLQAAGELAEQDHELSAAKKSGAKISQRVKVNRIIANAAYVTSLLAFENGSTSEALEHARRCVRLNHRAKAGLEALSKDIRRLNADPLAESMKALSLSQETPKIYSSTEQALNLPTVWPVVTPLYMAYTLSAEIYRHLGMVSEAFYFAKRALDLVKTVRAKPAITRALILVADIQIRSGQIADGEQTLEEARGMIVDVRLTVAFEVVLGNLKRLQGNSNEELKAYHRAQQAIESLLDAKQIQRFGQVGCIDESGLVEQLAGIGIKPPEKKTARPKTPTRSRSTKASKPLKAASIKTATKKDSPVPMVITECSLLHKQKGVITRLIAYNFALQGHCSSAMEALENASKLPAGPHEKITQGLVHSRNLLQEALDLVSADPIFNCLQDSTISLPSITMYGDIANPAVDTPVPVRKYTRKATAKKAKAFIEVLERARDCVYAVHKQAITIGSSSTVHRAASLLAGIIVLLSAMTSSKGHGPQHPLYASYSLELQKGIITRRHKHVVELEKFFANVPEQLQWPQIEMPDTKRYTINLESFEFNTFQSHFIDIVPKQWAVVSITLSENHDELYVSRFQAGQSQLMVRLPLTRHNSRDDYQDLFDYNDGLEEFKEILALTTISTRIAKNMAKKEDRLKWWGEREELDNRLRDLLENMEHVWLGGFKGIFCQYDKNPALFDRFKVNFDKLLSKHVPSRKKKKNGRVDIDDRILEFFIALGDPEKADLDEALIDLIYFVIDILQFHGEGNAYDEVDVDSMVVEMKDTLRAYHDEALWRPQDMETEVDHTILILEKSVQMFPWESIPCLRGHSVSRLPSLAALRDRILDMNKSDCGHERPGLYTGRTSGGYILNPSSDLTHTQKIFQDELTKLPGEWTPIINRPPTPIEFSEILDKKELMLYFGHGSGSNYIPAKFIRQLNRCAISCLMGCSSGALQDNGEFEPYGATSNYLLAGSPAVLATLWDVTDRDIDQFAKDVFEKWGLFSTDPKDQQNLNANRETKLKKAEKLKQGKSLVEAVASSREACKMPYLNGAAPVVYGIPVYINP